MYAWLDTFCQVNHGPDARFLDGVTFAALVKANFPGEEIEAAADLLCAVCLGARADEVSSLYVLEHMKSCGGLKGVLSVTKHGCCHQNLPGGKTPVYYQFGPSCGEKKLHCGFRYP